MFELLQIVAHCALTWDDAFIIKSYFLVATTVKGVYYKQAYHVLLIQSVKQAA